MILSLSCNFINQLRGATMLTIIKKEVYNQSFEIYTEEEMYRLCYKDLILFPNDYKKEFGESGYNQIIKKFEEENKLELYAIKKKS